MLDDPAPEDHRFGRSPDPVCGEKTDEIVGPAYRMLESEPFTEMPFHTLFVGGATAPKASTPGMITYMRDALKRHRRIAAIATGAFVLAEVGLLDGRNATTHWMHAPLLQAQYPAVKLDQDRIFINDGPVWTAAGGAAGLDLSLALIENDLGAEVAAAVACELVIYHYRTGAIHASAAIGSISSPAASGPYPRPFWK